MFYPHWPMVVFYMGLPLLVISYPDIVDPKEGGALGSLSEPSGSGWCCHIHHIHTCCHIHTWCCHIHPPRATDGSQLARPFLVDFLFIFGLYLLFLLLIYLTLKKKLHSKIFLKKVFSLNKLAGTVWHIGLETQLVKAAKYCQKLQIKSFVMLPKLT